MATEPQPGDFGLTQISGAGGWVVRFGQWLLGDGFENFEHAFVYVGDGMIVEAEPGGAREVPLSDYDGFTVDWSTGKFTMTDTQRVSVTSAALGFRGVPYSFLDYFALASHRLHMPWSPLLKRYISSTKHLICSQLVDEAYSMSGVHLYDDGRWPGYVTPGDLYHLLQTGV